MYLTLARWAIRFRVDTGILECLWRREGGLERGGRGDMWRLRMYLTLARWAIRFRVDTGILECLWRREGGLERGGRGDMKSRTADLWL